MVLRCVALLTAGRQVAQVIRTVLLPEPDMVYMEDGVIPDPPPAEYAGMMVTGGYGRP